MQRILISELHIEHLRLNLLHLVLEFLVLELFLGGLADDRDEPEHELLLLAHGCLGDECLSLGVLDSLSEYRDLVLHKDILTLHLLYLVVLVLHDLAQVHRLVLEPLQRLLQSVHSVVQLHLELLFGDRFLDKKQLLLNTQHMTLYPLVNDVNTLYAEMKSASCLCINPSTIMSIVSIDLCSWPYKNDIFSFVVISLY